MARTLLYLVRHGEQGPTPDGGLSELGREQARLLGRRLAGVPFATVHHSPLRRAVQTAEILADHLPGVPVHACDLVTDRTPTPVPGQESGYPERYRAFLDGVPHDERDVDATRLRAAVDHFGVTGTDDRRELLITHNFVIGWFVRHALDAPTWRWIGLNQANCGLTIIEWRAGEPRLTSFNDVGHLPA
jgi:probable phosphoglycerate mutase